MRRLITALALLAFVFLYAGCMGAFSAVQAVINAPGAAISALQGPRDTLGWPIRYETRPTVTAELVLQADGTYLVRTLPDSVVRDTGRFTYHFDTLHVGACTMRLTVAWAKGDCFGTHRMWRESPQHPYWPSTPAAPSHVTLFLPGDRRRLGIVTVPT